MILGRLHETYWQAFHTLSLKVFLLSCALLFTGFVCSRALVSIGMGGMVLAALLNAGNFSLSNFLRRKELLLLTVLFWGVLVSGLWSSDKNLWMNFTRIHLPYLFLPIAFGVLPSLSFAQLRAIASIYISIMVFSGCAVLINYLAHFDAINNSFSSGGVIPMPFSHIRYSLMLVFAFCAAVFYAMNTKGQSWAASRTMHIAVAVFLFALIHVLSVRSGLFALYVSLAVMIIAWIVTERKWKQAVLIVAASGLFATIAFNAIPSLEKRIYFMHYDLNQYKLGQPTNASDGMRLRSWHVALQVFKKSPAVGVGYGDLQNEMSAYYTTHFPELTAEQHKLPHNQWLWWLVSTGWIGALIFSLAIAYPFIKYFKSKVWLLHCFFAIIFSSFMWEATLEEQMGTGFFLVWLLLLLQHTSNQYEA